jgi:hypothetical protein
MAILPNFSRDIDGNELAQYHIHTCIEDCAVSDYVLLEQQVKDPVKSEPPTPNMQRRKIRFAALCSGHSN